MDVERTIGDIEQLQEMFEAPDIRPLSASDNSAANRRHEEMLAHAHGFRFGSGTGFAAVLEDSPDSVNPLLPPKFTQTHEPDLPLIFGQYRISREWNLPENPRRVPD